ncbi:PQQ-binding-like beta-propeller repeat protein [Verrucomicrobia bacterium]|nr:PQQ-binding-like beta-propeller repeat protein [Verrucomicrobiota bacterium]
MICQFFRIYILALFVTAISTIAVPAADWPMWRYDAQRSASSPEELLFHLNQQWNLDLGQRAQVWDDPLNHDLMPYDRVFEPIVLGKQMFVAFNDADKVVAFDLSTGRETWRFYSDGPVRLPPVGWKGAIYFACDDGFLYCVDAANGGLKWKFQGGPSNQKVLGNKRLISAWPARGGPVIRDGNIYFSASIWPFMGTFIYALDATSGDVIWVNDRTSADYIKQPHSAPSFAGVAPQGAFVATEDILLVPGGRSVPAAFDRKTGEQLHFRINDGGKGNGGSFVIANDNEFFVHTRLRGVRSYDLVSGKKGSFVLNEPVLAENSIYTASEFPNLKVRLASAESRFKSARNAEASAESRVKSAKGKNTTGSALKALEVARSQLSKYQAAVISLRKEWETSWQGPVIQGYTADKKIEWEFKADGRGDIIRAGNRLYAANKDEVFAITIPAKGEQPEVVWKHPVKGTVQRLLAANGRLLAVTLEGNIICFGVASASGNTVNLDIQNKPLTGAVVKKAKQLVNLANATDGYCLWHGLDDRELLKAVLENSNLRVVVVLDDLGKVEEHRRFFDNATQYGKRVTIHQGTPDNFKAPPYLANLVFLSPSVAKTLTTPSALKTVYQSVRPYGGLLWLPGSLQATQKYAALALASNLENAVINHLNTGHMTVRKGALPDSADWTHQYGDIANSVKSDDSRLKLPLGVLWFGGNSNEDVLPRHGHGPPELVIGGRTFLEGLNSLSARDVYTGRVFWKREFEDLGTFGIYYNETYADTPLDPAYNQKHIPGANARGSNFTATEDTVYLALRDQCLALDSATGKTRMTISLPKREGQSEAPQWGFIGVYEDTLFGGHGFANFSKKFAAPGKKQTPSIEDYSASDGLIAFDRHTGKTLWKIDARHSFPHNGIVAGNGRVYLLDKLPSSAEAKISRRGNKVPTDYRIIAIDSRTGKKLWENSNHITGSWLGYSMDRDLLLQAGAAASDRSKDEVAKGMSTLRGNDGTVLWTRPDLKYSGPCILHNDLIVANANQHSNRKPNYEASTVFNLLDGTDVKIENPLTGLMEPWRIERGKGCNSIIACENFLTFRDGSASYYDLKTKNGTGSFGGFKSGCTANLVVANGVLNAPDYTRTCSCSYQNQTSLALIHMPGLDMWTTSLVATRPSDQNQIKRIGINLGAPGDRKTYGGTLWLEHPAIGGKSPAVSIETTGKDLRFFRHHTSRVKAEAENWIAASGAVNLESISIQLRLASESAPASSKSNTTRIQTGRSDDTAEEAADGSMNTKSSDLELVNDKNRQTIGIRFPNLKATSTSKLAGAFIQFVVDETGTTPTQLQIQAEMSDNAASFSSKQHGISSRSLTKSKVTWSPVAWKKKDEKGINQRTPDLSSLIAEVTSRKGWKSGNAIVFIISGSGKRVAVANGDDAPTLVTEGIPPVETTAAIAPKVEPKHYYTVRLHFMEPEALEHGDRVFDVALQGKTVLHSFDVLAEAGAQEQGIVREFKRVAVGDTLNIDFNTAEGSSAGASLSGIEMIALP